MTVGFGRRRVAFSAMVFAQTTIAIGTIGVASVIQPALAVVWSFLLLSEAVRGRQMVGITVAIVGLGAFLAFNERGERSPIGRTVAAAVDR
jgi:drug/metabolite transporter (DMT)-like permease